MRHKIVSLKNGVYYTLIIILLSTVVVLASVWFVNEKNNFNTRSEELTISYEAQQKSYLIEEVNKSITIINSIREYHLGKDEELIKEEILTVLAEVRLKHSGYIFINQFDGQALLFDGKKVEEVKDLTDMVDPSGLRIFDIEKEAYHAVEGKFMEYLFKKIDSSTPESKISFMKGYSDWEWIIGAGTYKDIPAKELNQLKESFYLSYKRNLTWLFIISFFLVVVCFILVKSIDNKLRRQVNSITNFLNEAALSDNLLDTKLLLYRELNTIGNSLNRMIVEKRELTKQVIEKDKDIKSIFSAAINVGFIITDMNGEDSVIMEFSPGAENLFGYQRSEMIGKKISIIHYPGDEKNFFRFQKVISKKEKGFQSETRLIRKGNKPFDVLFSTHQLHRSNKEDAVIGVIVDISKRKKAETELRLLKDSLENKVDERTHELIDINKELTEKNKKLEKFNDLFVGREFRIKELKNKVKELENIIKGMNG